MLMKTPYCAVFIVVIVVGSAAAKTSPFFGAIIGEQMTFRANPEENRLSTLLESLTRSESTIPFAFGSVVELRYPIIYQALNTEITFEENYTRSIKSRSTSNTEQTHISWVFELQDQIFSAAVAQAALQPLCPKPIALHGVAVTQVRDPEPGLVEPHTVDLSPSIQPVQIPLQIHPTLKQINTLAQLGVICKLIEKAPNPPIQIIDNNIKNNWPQY
ncbi:hypothetical protein llap_20704 [Limosa lapponica baueri]|uniref:Uncharacterized protein n=1 Tax=Limosa lapponica baueri TaxID=1758121 RepID=A0A2I0T5D2_LIMLA|nr:hypothetical protein llap_20704 [Limosa lapponica baueri]